MAQLQIPLADLTSVRYVVGDTVNEAHTAHFGSAATWCKPFTLSVPALPEGVASCTVQRLSTNCTLGSVGTLVSAGQAATTAAIYYGDTLAVSAQAAYDYQEPVVTLSASAVTGDVSVSITAGAYNWTIPRSKTNLPLTINGSGSFSCVYQHCYVADTCSFEDCDGCYCANGLACGESLTVCEDVQSGLKDATTINLTITSGSVMGYSSYDDCGCDGCYCTDGSDCHYTYLNPTSTTISPQTVEMAVGSTVTLASSNPSVNPTLKSEYVASGNYIRFILDGTTGPYNKTKRLVISELAYRK